MEEIKKYRIITIIPVLNGFSCTVGCQTVVFNRCDDMINALRSYLESPEEVEEAYIKNSMIHQSTLYFGDLPRPIPDSNAENREGFRPVLNNVTT